MDMIYSIGRTVGVRLNFRKEENCPADDLTQPPPLKKARFEDEGSNYEKEKEAEPKKEESPLPEKKNNTKQLALVQNCIRAEKWRSARMQALFRRKNLLYMRGTYNAKTELSSNVLRLPPPLCLANVHQPEDKTKREKVADLEKIAVVLSKRTYKKDIRVMRDEERMKNPDTREKFNVASLAKKVKLTHGNRISPRTLMKFGPNILGIDGIRIGDNCPGSSASLPSTTGSDGNSEFYTLRFIDLRSNLISGDRKAEVEVFTVPTARGKYLHPKRIPSALMTMPMNRRTKRLIDVPTNCINSGISQLLIAVKISTDRSNVTIEGRKFRNTTGRPTHTAPVKGGPLEWEFLMYGTLCLDFEEEGDYSITLIEKERMGLETTHPKFIKTLETMAKRHHNNPFVRLSIGTPDEESSTSDSSGSTASLERKKVPIESMVDAYLKRATYDASGNYIAEKQEIDAYYDQRLGRKEHRILKDWMAKIRVDHVHEIYKTSFLFPMLFHLTTCHSRFVFTLAPPNVTQEENKVFINVHRNLKYNEDIEVINPKEGPKKKVATAPIFMITKDRARYLRSRLRMDVTMFFRPFIAPELARTGPEAPKNCVNTRTGSRITQNSQLYTRPRNIPPPSYDALQRRMDETIVDYIDIDDKSKLFMRYWNQVILAIGKANVPLIGNYMAHRVFLHNFLEYMKESQILDCFMAQVVELVDKGGLSGDDQYDLMKRIVDRKYKPLEDPHHPLFLTLMNYARSHNWKHKLLTERGIKNPKLPFDMSHEEQCKIVETLWRSGTALQISDYRRAYMQNPADVFGPAGSRVFEEMTPAIP